VKLVPRYDTTAGEHVYCSVPECYPVFRESPELSKSESCLFLVCDHAAQKSARVSCLLAVIHGQDADISKSRRRRVDIDNMELLPTHCVQLQENGNFKCITPPEKVANAKARVDVMEVVEKFVMGDLYK